MISHITRFIDLRSKSFFVVPIPQEDELLSSWMIRVALTHDTLPWTFYNLHFPEYKNIIFSRDLDVWAPHHLLEKLATKSNLAFEQIYQMTLKSYEDIFHTNITGKTSNKYINPIICRGRRNQGYGQRFCPQCLSQAIPYFKKEWRLKSCTVCTVHNRKLLERCPKCKAPVTPSKFKNNYGFASCWLCSNPLYNG